MDRSFLFERIQLSSEELAQALASRPGLILSGSEKLIFALHQLGAVIREAGKPPLANVLEEPREMLEYLVQVRRALASVKRAALTFEEPCHAHLPTERVLILINGFGQLLTTLERQLQGTSPIGRESTDHLSHHIGDAQQLRQDLSKREGQETSLVRFTFNGLAQINERDGREAGNEILQNIAEIIRTTGLGEGQTYKDGPGFSVIGDWSQAAQAENFSGKVMEQVHKLPKANRLDAVIGVVLNETEKVLQRAQIAVEQSRKGKPAIFQPEMETEKERENQEYQTALDILEHKRFFPVYQEIFNKSKGLFRKSRRKFEVLWRSEGLSPIRFFRAMKEERRIHEVTEAFLPMVFKEIRRLDVDIAINFTTEELGQTIRGRSYFDFFEDLIDQYGVSSTSLIIELVEWGEEDELSPESMSTLKKMVKAGCRLALDDYGVRSSNLVRLMQLCEHGIIPDYFKVDAALVKGLNKLLIDGERGEKHRFSVIGIKSIVDLVRELRQETDKPIDLVAEFVDNPTLLKALDKLGITQFQGFYLAKPKPAAEAFGN
ncbi:EAL domain-containing protein [Sulfidibacter corallicola]|uniref:EAL domain-containing protein n=1 Tax=Sulfidibacter corallicola TaxID=2818388 RepID=A0A8A4TKU4_SULCO|nr:EAL domain-containing protein [Sulfidibacter corallicola]QTD49501.1 EAL domain-containing protein [Sulfidibacter corallicola]